MTSFTELLQQGAAHAWLFIPTATMLGALHGLEPGHSKTMMAAFIVAVRGTVGQAVLLGLAATISHTLVVWGVALGGLYLWKDMTPETTEPYFQLASGLAMLGMAIWMYTRIHKSVSHHHHDHTDCGHNHADEIQRRFAGGSATTGQIIMFGLTGGLIPCPAAITILLICLQLKEIPLGATLVLCFSVGLALTLIAVGVAAAVSLKHAEKRYSWFGDFMYKAPYVSVALIGIIGLYVTLHGWNAIGHVTAG